MIIKRKVQKYSVLLQETISLCPTYGLTGGMMIDTD